MNRPIYLNKQMIKAGVPPRLRQSKYKKIPPLNHQGFISLELNGKTFSPENLSQSLYRNAEQLYDYSSRFDHEGSKFRVRSPSSFVKTAHNWKNIPYQRIKNVDKAIQITKIKQNMSMPHNTSKILPQFSNFSPSSTSPNTASKPHRNQTKLRLNNRTQYRTSRGWFKQNQHQRLRKSIQENRQKQNIIRLKQPVKNTHPKHILSNCQADNDERYFFPKQSQRRIQKKQDMYERNRSTLYAYIMKNRKKLSDKRQKKKTSIDYSLLERLQCLEDEGEDEQQKSNGLKISLKKVMFSEYKGK